MIVDTDFVIDLLRNDASATQKLQKFSEQGESFFMTVLTVFELFNGVSRSSRPEQEREKVKTALKNQAIIGFDEKSAETAGEICGLLAHQGTPVGAIDCMIAGIAIHAHKTVLTRNVRDFGKIRGLTIESY